MNISIESRAGKDAIELINPLEDRGWDESLSNYSGSTFFHGSAWAKVLRDTYGFQPIYLSLNTGTTEAALLPLMEVKSPLTGRRGVALPFTDECAPLCANTIDGQKLLAAAQALGGKRGWKYLEIRGGRAFFSPATASTRYFGHRLDLRGGEDALFSRADSAVRRAIRKAELSELTITIGHDAIAVETFYSLLCKTRRRHGVPAQPYGFFAAIQRHVLARKQGCIVLAHHGKTPVAGAVFLHSGSTVIYKFGASDESFQHLRANNLVMWTAIKAFSAQGFTSLDFGRTSLTNEGLRKFKLSWGTTEHSVEYVRYHYARRGFVTVDDAAAGWYNAIFRVLPIPLSRLAGTLLYRHIA